MIITLLYKQGLKVIMNMRNLSLASSLLIGLAMTQMTQANDGNIEVTPDQQVTKQELAAIYVISEVCPAIVSDKENFSSGFSKLAKEFLPNEKNPVDALNSLVKTNDFKPILEEARADAAQAGDEKNKAICEELVAYNK
jgi:PleD family two-component response regulator